MTTPFFPAWRSRLAARGRSARTCRSAAEVEHQFAQFLPKDLLKRASRGEGSRDRIYSRHRSFWCFLWQVLQPRTPCRAVVRKVQAEVENSHRKIDESSSAYCQARARLPIDLLDKALQHVAMCAERKATDGVPGWNRPVKVVDVTSAQLPDTVTNGEQYRYPTGQKKGCGFPVLRVLAMFSLASGAILRITTAACYTAELVMFRALRSTLEPGDILLGDRMYGCFPLLAALPLQGVDVVARLHQGRNLDLRRAPQLGQNDWLVTLHKAYIIPPYMPAKEWKTLPDTIRVRIIRSSIAMRGFRTKTIWIITTLLDPKRYPAKALICLYLRRWEMELTFRDLKTTMGMESLRCLTPTMIEKELRMFIVAYNCLRALMVESALKYQLPAHRISFKGTVDTIRSFYPAMLRAASSRILNHLRSRLLAILAKDAIPSRAGRSEPRAVKRRPKNYPMLTAQRSIFKAIPHRGNPRPCIRPQVILT